MSLESIDDVYLEAARDIALQVDGLPLALDQAGAFIQAMSFTPASIGLFIRRREKRYVPSETAAKRMSMRQSVLLSRSH